MSQQILSQPLRMGHLVLPNRIVVPAMHTNLASTQGEVTEAMINHYTRRACGGAGLLMVEVATVQYPLGRQSLTELQIDSSNCLPGLSRLATAIKATGTVVFLQLFHAGAQTLPYLNGGQTPVSPSGVPIRVTGTLPRVLEHEEIIDLRQRFIQAGIWAAEAGFDGVELHAAHGYLLSEFISPLTNRRHDEYGGHREGRCRLLIEIIQGIKSHCPQLVISVRINGDDFLPGGITGNEASAIACLLEQAGADAINVSAGMYDSGLTSIESNAYDEGWRLNLSAAVKSAVSIPVIGGGVIHSPAQAAAALEHGELDLVYVGRASLADFTWPHKALGDSNGAANDLRPCIRCNTCVASSFAGGPIRCAVNPEAGGPPDTREVDAGRGAFYWLNWQDNTGADQAARDHIGSKVAISPGSTVLVVGSGPAGMMAALTAAHNGYQVTLVEKSPNLGGLLTLAALPQHKERIAQFRDYLINEMKLAGIDLITGQTAETAWIKQQSPDLLVAALGSQPLILEGLTTDTPVLTVADALSGNYFSQRCLVIGGGETGLETAQTLASKGAEVTVIERSAQLAPTMEKKNRRSLLNSLKTLPVTIYPSSTLKSFEHGLATLLTPEGECQLAVDYIIPALGREPIPIPNEWLDLGIPILVLGDAVTVGNIAAATRAAYLALTSERLGSGSNSSPFA